jgi:hypothetical protein
VRHPFSEFGGLARTEIAPDEVLHEIQSTLAALADVETRHELERERLDQWSGPGSLKRRVADELDSLRVRERAPITQRVERLEQQMKMAMFGSGRLVR